MKFWNFILASILLAISSSANAAPIYYVFDGTLNGIDDSAGLAAEQNLTIGSTFRTVFLVDTQESGTETLLSMYPIQNQEYTQTLTDITSSIGTSTDYFYTDLISQPLLYGNSRGDLGTIEENYGYYFTEQFLPDRFYLSGSNSPDTTGAITELTAYYQQLSELVVGKEFSFKETASTGEGAAYLRTTLYGTVTLVNVTNVAPVPVPAAVWLFGSGLIGLIGIARRKARS